MDRMRAPKAWNGGSKERALDLAAERRKLLVSQGAAYCNACGGAGGTAHALCEACGGAGVIIPSGGLTLARPS